MRRAAFSGMPVALTVAQRRGIRAAAAALFIGGRNLTATKARLLLMACLMKLGSMPAAADPDRPTAGEIEAVGRKLREYRKCSTALSRAVAGGSYLPRTARARTTDSP